MGPDPQAAAIATHIRPLIEAMGFHLVRVKLSGGRHKTLQIMAERADGTIDIDDCAEISQAVSGLLDVEDPLAGAYMLEVSSPGLDRPLVEARDFERFTGHVAKIKLRQPQGGQKRFVGTLMGVSDGDVALRPRTGSGTQSSGGQDAALLHLPLALIDDAHLIITDALIEHSLKGRETHKRDKAS